MKVQVARFCLFVLISAILLVISNPVGFQPTGASAQVDDQEQVGEEGLEVEGRLVPKEFANLALRMDGRVEEVFVQAGTQVESGQVLLRLEGGEDFLADLADAELDLLLARQALETLNENAGLERAQAEKELALAEKELNAAEYHLRSVERGASQMAIDQAYANMRLAENVLNKAQDELARTARQFDNGKDPIWLFVNRKQVKLLLTVLERNVSTIQEKYEDAIQKYQDLIAPADEIDLAMAEADLAVAQNRIRDAEEKLASLSDGPDPEEIALAQARIRVAEAAIAASKEALQELELHAPFAGTVVDVNTKAGEWVETGNPVVVLASLAGWVVETQDLTELQVPGIERGQGVVVRPEALPSVSLPGTVESISRISEVKSGDVTYTTDILLEEFDPRLRWGMTVSVDFDP